MKIHAVHVRRFRSVERAALTACGGLNVLIGKNNSGKSNLLAAIDLVQRHLARAAIAAPWPTERRPTDEFTDRICDQPFQIGIEYDLPADLNEQLRAAIQSQAPHLERSIDQLKDQKRISIIVSGAHEAPGDFVFIQTIGAGTLTDSGDALTVTGMTLLDVPLAVAAELFSFHREFTSHHTDVEALDSLLRDPQRLRYMVEAGEPARYAYRTEMRPQLNREVTRIFASIKDIEAVQTKLTELRAESRGKMDALEHRETQGAMNAFAGPTRSPPNYALAVPRYFGRKKVLHLKETREAVGREEAEALLTLKVTRGASERLASVQRTVKSLLGVNVDAFQSEASHRGPGRAAEIDIDQFLIDANGAGVREALRLVLDLELKAPALVLIEEPEVHLHPGLENSVYQYLRDKGESIQLFVTTHSTNFIDSVSFKNIYLVSKKGASRTTVQTLDATESTQQIPSELGLRLSTVFMYERLVFVEGPSDETVIRELCKTLDYDVATANVGFVQMGGIRNFAHFAAEATVELLARRRIRMWFVVDRDERNDQDVQRMIQRLGDRATLHVLRRRELENYLLDPEAVAKFVQVKRRLSGQPDDIPDVREVSAALRDEAIGLREQVARLLLIKEVLAPLYLSNRQLGSDIPDRLDAAISDLQNRRQQLDGTKSQIMASIDSDWEATALDKAPGALILEKVAARYGVAFKKENGDSTRLAQCHSARGIPAELAQLLRSVTQT